MVKLIDILKEAIEEAKQVGPIYHFTSYKSLMRIIKDGYKLKDYISANLPQVKASEKLYPSYVSFTRKKDLYSETIYRQCRITVDGDKLSNYYKITPYADVARGFGRSSTDEAEERILVKPEGGYVDISKVIKAIDIMKPENTVDPETGYELDTEEEYEKLIKFLKDNNVQYNVVSSYSK